MLGRRFVGRLRMTGQYSADRLSGNERLAVGGPDYGRAFDTALLSGDRGLAGSFELAFRPELTPRLKGTEIYGFIDGAREIGRAEGRERVCRYVSISGVAGSLKKQNTK